MTSLKLHRELQNIAKEVLEELGQTISPADMERTIEERAVSMLGDRGIKQTWYYDCPAFVLAGSRSWLSISGQQYSPSDEPIENHNVVAVDLSPLRDGLGGDCARSFLIENGKSVLKPNTTKFQRGLNLEHLLHQFMREFVSESTTFEELQDFANELIKSNGFENLDFIGNLGHSIVSRLDGRIYIETGKSIILIDVEYFSFEPHVRTMDGNWGFKIENIYFTTEKENLKNYKN